jgi:hypothetical protein
VVKLLYQAKVCAGRTDIPSSKSFFLGVYPPQIPRARFARSFPLARVPPYDCNWLTRGEGISGVQGSERSEPQGPRKEKAHAKAYEGPLSLCTRRKDIPLFEPSYPVETPQTSIRRFNSGFASNEGPSISHTKGHGDRRKPEGTETRGFRVRIARLRAPLVTRRGRFTSV